jgi:hypothetical protein
MNQKEIDKPASTEPMPVLFIGHGSPMNAIEDNEFSKAWREVAKILPKPKAILCISAHWETRGMCNSAEPGLYQAGIGALCSGKRTGSSSATGRPYSWQREFGA